MRGDFSDKAVKMSSWSEQRIEVDAYRLWILIKWDGGVIDEDGSSTPCSME
jgi:hypothetical protein